MGLINLFRNIFDSKLTPLTTEEKIYFVKVFLQTKDIIPKNFGDIEGDDMKSIAGTPQYTLVMYLDFLYTFMANGSIRNNHIAKAAKSGIDLHDFSLSTSSLLKLAEYYTAFRKLPDYGYKWIYEEWQNNISSSGKDSFETFKDACYWWVDNIIEPLQVFDCQEIKIEEKITDDGYWDKVEQQLSLNYSLIDAYLEMRVIE
jgi:hypothetical protein